ncbi:MAG TPA: cbb3-type cytochrome oxidase assembly protein CcoS [Myxococcales bacterium LLY-WYZ-16_1]|jgi:cbb3-type cytochrome oxidase maturation protein|nr:cbb3-type cytochrome oxidase assembly protein CcoS [Myxococcales bacterium LLY-WYZ-16_1]
MSVLFVVVPLALFIAFASVMAFVWSVQSGQLDDLDSPAIRMLHDEAPQARTDREASSEEQAA